LTDRAKSRPRGANLTPLATEFYMDDLLFLRRMAAQLGVDAFIAWLADRQHGVVARWQLQECDVPRGEIAARLHRKRLFRVHRGVFSVGRRKLTPEGRFMAAVLRCGEGAVLSHESAAHHYRAVRNFPEIIEVTIPRGRTRPRQVPFETYHATFHPAEVAIKDDIPVTSFARTLLDLSATRREETVKHAFEHVERRPHELHAVARIVDRHAGERGIKTLRKLLANYARHTGMTRSTFEIEFKNWLEARGIPLPELNQKVPIEDEVFMPDCLWRAARLIVELDTWDFHGFPAARERDSRRDRVLGLAEYSVFRVVPNDLLGERGAELESQLRTRLARREPLLLVP
jgi:very-short-patch-repair endonuclease